MMIFKIDRRDMKKKVMKKLNKMIYKEKYNGVKVMRNGRKEFVEKILFVLSVVKKDTLVAIVLENKDIFMQMTTYE